MRKLAILLLTLSFIHCKGPEARKPVQVKTGTFMKQSVERNKILLAQEEKLIEKIIESDSLHEYIQTDFGAWYYYDQESEQEGALPGTDDLVTLTYNLVDMNNDTIYSADDIGILEYRVDKQEYFPGLRQSVKVLKAGETATFLFPSVLGYGYHGDDEKIGANVPLRSTITLIKIEKNTDSIPN